MDSARGVALTATKLSKMNLSDKIDAFSYIGHLHSFKIHWYRHAKSGPTNIEKYLTNSCNFAQKSRKWRQGCAKTWKYQKLLRILLVNTFQKFIRCPNTLYLRFYNIWLTTDACRRIFNKKYVKNSSFSAQIPRMKPVPGGTPSDEIFFEKKRQIWCLKRERVFYWGKMIGKKTNDFFCLFFNDFSSIRYSFSL